MAIDSIWSNLSEMLNPWITKNKIARIQCPFRKVEEKVHSDCNVWNNKSISACTHSTQGVLTVGLLWLQVCVRSVSQTDGSAVGELVFKKTETWNTPKLTLSFSPSCASGPQTVTNSIPSPIVHCPVWCWQNKARQGEGGREREGREREGKQPNELTDDCLSQRQREIWGDLRERSRESERLHCRQASGRHRRAI